MYEVGVGPMELEINLEVRLSICDWQRKLAGDLAIVLKPKKRHSTLCDIKTNHPYVFCAVNAFKYMLHFGNERDFTLPLRWVETDV